MKPPSETQFNNNDISILSTYAAFMRLWKWHYETRYCYMNENNKGGCTTPQQSYFKKKVNSKNRFWKSESIENVIRIFCEFQGWHVSKPHDKGIKIYNPKTGKDLWVRTKYTEAGVADRVITIPYKGYSLIINAEVKAGSDTQKDLQKQKEAEAIANNQLYFIIHKVDDFWNVIDLLIEKYGINILYTAPTAIRGLMRFGDAWPNRHDLSSLRLLGSVGEPINPEAWKWYYKVIGKEKCPIMDTWWQTETGMFMITPMPGIPLKPGSGTFPFPGLKMDILDEKGESVAENEEGYLVIKTPWPAMVRTIYKDPDKYVNQYWSKFPGVYLTGDSARRDKDGYYWIIGRVDDVIKVSGYRLGTAEIESALVSHPAVAEAAAIGLPHEIKGHAIFAYVILRNGFSKSDQLIEELIQHVGHEVGPIAKPEHIEIVDSLPKTRSGKIMRRVLKAKALGQDPGNISTLEE